ncbi:GumC family protein [Acuticoccus kandeliae]|uniref:GumC family protein n=1 Tax=Acuticoccus kandeliae TaxID=2073160 RepID=UPI001300851F|nr:polysaccharide biosynthesis tyrosine autokinase [Acuticoccus kandeliae]
MKITSGYPAEAYPIKPLEDAEGGDDLHLRKVFTLLWRGRWIILIGATVGLVLAAIYVASIRPTFTAVATVLFSPEEKNIVNIQDVLESSRSDGLRNQIEILKSTALMARVVEELSLHRTPQFNPSLSAERSLFDQIKSIFDLTNLVPWTFLANIGVVSLPEEGVLVTEEEIERRQVTVARNILMNSVEYVPVPDSRVIQIKVTTRIPSQSSRVANEISKQYITARLDAKLAATRDATRWLNERVEELRGELEAAEEAVTRSSSEITDRVGQSSAVLRQQLAALSEGYADASARRSTAQIRYQRAIDALKDTNRIAALAEFQNSDMVTRYRTEELELLSERATLEKLVPEGHERLNALDARITNARTNMRSEAERVVGALESEVAIALSEESEFEAKVRALETRIQEQESSEIELRQLEREADASRLIYENFLGRLKETTQQEKLEEADAVVLSPAEPPAWADSASKKRTLALGGVVGALGGLGLVMLLDRLNRTFRGFDELQDATGLPLLGAVPSIGRSATRSDVVNYVLDKPTSHLAEAIRNMRTSILFSKIDDPPKVVMLTSTVPEEAKSTTSLLLAVTSAQMGKSAIIVDCDLRRPSLHTGLQNNSDDMIGLRDVLEGTVALEDACYQDEDTGLSVLTSHSEASMATNAADILASERFASIVRKLRERFDLVILDAPPILSVTDARIISPHADAVLYCVRWDHTPREAVAEGLRELSLVHSKISGTVMTRVDSDKANSYGYSSYGASYYRSGYNNKYYEN